MGELALGLLDQVGHEAVQRAQNCAVQHHGGSFFGAVLVHIGQVELCGQAEVQLAGGQGVLGTHGGLHVHVQLRAVESSLADLLGEVDAQLGQHLAQSALGVVPHGIVIVVLFSCRRGRAGSARSGSR